MKEDIYYEQVSDVVERRIGFASKNLMPERPEAERIDARTRNFVKTEERGQLVLDITQTLNIGFYEELKFPK